MECASITASDQSEESVVSLSDNKILSNFSFENDLIEGDILFGQNPDIFVTKEVLPHQLDELLRQSIIAPVDESESVPIRSPIVLVSKHRCKLTDLTKVDVSSDHAKVGRR